MAKYSNLKIRRFLFESDNAPSNDVKGDKLEELVRYLFDKIRGVSFHKKNVLDGVRAHELDVVFTNDKRISALYFLDFAIITECKNTTHRLGSNEVRWFISKLVDRGYNAGILISLSGISGASSGISNAHSEILMAITRDKVKILLLNRQEIESLNTTDDLVNILHEKILKLTIERTI